MATAAPPPSARRRRAGWAPAAVLATGLALVACSPPAGVTEPAPSPPPAVPVEEDAPATRNEPAPEPQALVTTEPDEYSEVGDLVEGFPIELLPVPGDAVILVTSAVPVGDADVQEVSLNLRTAMRAPDLLALYRDALTEAGFSEVEQAAPGDDLAVDVTFVRSGGDELVSIGVLDVDGGRTVTIGGRVRVEA